MAPGVLVPPHVQFGNNYGSFLHLAIWRTPREKLHEIQQRQLLCLSRLRCLYHNRKCRSLWLRPYSHVLPYLTYLPVQPFPAVAVPGTEGDYSCTSLELYHSQSILIRLVCGVGMVGISSEKPAFDTVRAWRFWIPTSYACNKAQLLLEHTTWL